MDIRYNFHVLSRILKRKIELVWIEEAIYYPDYTTREYKSFIVKNKLNGKCIEVVYEKEKYINVKTAYWV
jgi:hypothetical protein